MQGAVRRVFLGFHAPEAAVPANRLAMVISIRADLRELRISLNSVIPGCQSAFNFDLRSRVQFCPLEPPLADAVGMSTRNLARHFVSETGITPHEFVERARIDTPLAAGG
jgi:AraC-like DNA-binding protein